MSEAIVGSMLWKLQQLALTEARTLAAVDEDIRSLRDKLMWMQAFLQDVQPSRRVQPNELIKVWLQQTRDSVFDAEDAVDQYFIQIDLSRFPSWSRAAFRFFARFTTQIRVRHDLSRRIRSINVRLEGIITHKDMYRIAESTMLGSSWRSSRSTLPLSEKMDDVIVPLVGREQTINSLKASLVESDAHHRRVITVIGESGVGKTKLVRHLYDRRRTLSHFDIHEWVSFGHNLSASDVLKIVVSRITDGEECPKKEIEDRLKRELEGRKYLLVIDAELSNSEWNRIFYMLPRDVAAGRIVRISQSLPEKPPPAYEETKIVVKTCDDEEAIHLFKQTLSMDETNEIPPGAIEYYRRKILDNTKGLPLAVVLLSGLLRTKEYPNEWKTVFDHLEKIQSKKIDKILSLCFDDLHYDLKSCLLYFAALPVNTLVRAQSIVCMWMAEGFLIPKATTVEKVGEQYLKELIDRRLVNLAPGSYDVPGSERVSVQSKVHAFLQLEAQEQSFVEINSGDDTPALSTVRRLSLQNHKDKYAALERPLPKLRAILSNFEMEQEDACEGEAGGEQDGNGNGVGPDCPVRCCPSFSKAEATKKKKKKKQTQSCVQELLQNSKFLRVIHFNVLEVGKELPTEVGGLVNLQYLRVTYCSLEKIPESISKLSNLQTLDVRGTKVRSLPADVWWIKTLRHVLGDLLILPRRVGHLRRLQTLSSVKPDDNDGWDDKTFSNKIPLWYLHIRQNQEALHTNYRAALVKAVALLKYLVVLIIKAPSIPSEVFTRSNLPRLKAMDLVGKLVGLPQQEGTPTIHLPNLRKLRLKMTMVSQEFINQLGQLPMLSTLDLRKSSYNDSQSQLIFDGGFNSLKELMVRAEKLIRIEIHEGALPQLRELDLDLLSLSKDFRVEIHGHADLLKHIKTEDQELFQITVTDVQVQVQNNEGDSDA